METCVKTCPTKLEAAAAASPPKQAMGSVLEKLKELDTLLKAGLITKIEYDAKRQEILKAM